MIYGSLKSADRYAAAFPDVAKALSVIKEYTAENFADGKRVIDGDDIFLNLFGYETKAKEEKIFEAHRKYIDVMYVVDGEETVLVKDTAALTKITKEYEDKDDYLLGALDADASAIRLFPGMFLVLFPEDAHAPGCNTEGSHAVKKIVGKVRIK